MTDKTHTAVVDGERLLAFSSFLKKGSCEFESTVLGGSMGKALPPGSRIRARFASDANLVAGQVVTYVANARIVVHRLLKIATSRGDRYVITCGDGTVCCDAPTPVSAVIGILTEFQSNGIWRPVPQLQPHSFSFRVMASVCSRMVVAALWLNPRFANRVAVHIFETHSMVLRSVELVKRRVRRNPPKQPMQRP